MPDALPRKDLLSWELALAKLETLPADAQENFFDRFGAAARDHVNPVVRTAVLNSLGRGAPAALLRVAMLGAAVTGDITVLVRARHETHAYEITAHTWRDPDELIANPVTLALTGRFIVARELLPHRSLDVELAGADLFVGEAQFKALIKAGAGSEGARNRVAQETLDNFLKQHPGDRLTIDAHLQMMRLRFPGASARSLKRAIRLARPKEWWKGGRPKGI